MNTITPGMHVRNEEYWIAYVLRDLFKVFGTVAMIDTGSTDNTIEIAKKTADKYHGNLELIQEDMSDNAIAIGQCPSRLREMIDTKWMLLVDGDEIWQETQLRALQIQADILPVNYQVVMFNGRNLTDVTDKLLERDGFVADRLLERDGFVADRLFSPEVRWEVRQDYPFQSHGLEIRDREGNVFRADHTGMWFWHVRH